VGTEKKLLLAFVGNNSKWRTFFAYSLIRKQLWKFQFIGICKEQEKKVFPRNEIYKLKNTDEKKYKVGE
jgi:hypothetical protein